jgi:(1->4)-alpha-D-glucan 1-alpha-D-glucosylmutase
LQLPAGEWIDRLTARRFTGRVDVADLFAELPVTLLEQAHA